MASTFTETATIVPGDESLLPGPRPIPVLGWRGRVIPILLDPAMRMLEINRTYGDLAVLSRDKGSPVFIFSPEYTRQLLSDQFLFYSLNTQDKASPIRMPEGTAAARLLAGIAGMNGEKHVRQRRMMMPVFHRKYIEGFRDTVVAVTDRWISRWEPGAVIDIEREMKDLSLNMAVSVLIGMDPDREGVYVRDLLNRWSARALSIPVGLFPFDVKGTPYYRFLRLSEQLEITFNEIIRRKRESGQDVGDALAMLLHTRDEDGSALSDVDLLGHLTTLFTAGHETTASSLTWTLFLLSQFPRVASELLDELDSKLGGKAPTVEQLGDLPVLDRVIKESMRMFPPAIWFIRISTAPFTIGPFNLPEGTRLVASPAVIHRRSDLYPQPNRFLPERWKGLRPSPYEYMPFGAGPRRCLGAEFAMLELKTVIPMVMQRYRLTFKDGARVDRGGTILSFPKGKMPMSVSRQDRRFIVGRATGNVHDLVDFN